MRTYRTTTIIAALICLGVAFLGGCGGGQCESNVPCDEKVEKGEKAIVVAPIGPWTASGGWGSRELRTAKNARIDTTKGHSEFVVEDAESLHVWKRYGLAVSIAEYPIAVIKYRARNIVPGWYFIWADDGAGPWGGCPVFMLKDLVADGKVHEIRADLREVREVHTNKIKKLNEKGSVVGMTLAVKSGKKTPASIELIDLRFLPEE